MLRGLHQLQSLTFLISQRYNLGVVVYPLASTRNHVQTYELLLSQISESPSPPLHIFQEWTQH